MSLFHTIPFVLVIHAKFAWVSVAAVTIAIAAIAIIFAVLIRCLFLGCFGSALLDWSEVDCGSRLFFVGLVCFVFG